MAEALAGSGVELIQYRSKTASSRQFFEVSRNLSSALRPRGVRFIVNDRPDIALLAGAGGVHVGQDDLSVRDARAVVRPGSLGGIFHPHARSGGRGGRDFRGLHCLRPDFPDRHEEKSRPRRRHRASEKRRARLTNKPLVAIGGITLERAAEVYGAGADSLAVIRDLICVPNPAARAREYLDVAASAATREV